MFYEYTKHWPTWVKYLLSALMIPLAPMLAIGFVAVVIPVMLVYMIYEELFTTTPQIRRIRGPLR